MLLLAGVVFCLLGGMDVAHFCLWDTYKDSTNIPVVSAGYIKSVGAVFHPIRKQ